MRNKNNKKAINKIAKITGLVAGALALSLGIIAINYDDIKSNDPIFYKYTDYYKGSQAQISTPGSMSSDDYITMTAAATLGTNNNKTITISTSDELVSFSNICNSNTAFLGYNYVLLSNIEFSSSNNFIPVGWKGTAFSGTFDGQGYEIDGLKMTFTSTSGYTAMDYFSMFSENSGTIKNIGITNPSIATSVANDNWAGDGGVSVLVGKNTGTVENSFIVDDGDALSQEAGIAASGGCRIADLCVLNTGTLSNNYVITSAVVNTKTTDYIEFTEIALKNTGTLSNNFYYNGSILSYNSGTIEYKEAYNLDGKTGQTIGTYCATPSALVTALHTADNTWYIPSDYGDLSRYVGIDYAIRRGVTYDNNTKTITIANAKDYAYMYELFNEDDYMASNALTYNITADIDLSLIPSTSYIYKKGIAATITGSVIAGTPGLINGSNSAYPTIYNADIMNSARIAKATGVDCYGLFNYLTGTVSNLNIVPLSMDLNDVDSTSNNVKGIGVLSGYIEGGSINNVNIYATIVNSENKNIGEHYIGGLCGILGGEAKVSNVTTAGSMTFESTSHTIDTSSSYMKGIAIGGIVGYVESSLGALYTCLNAMNITSYLGTSTDYAIGGVIGAGYTMNYGKDASDNVIRTSQLENTGNIVAGNSSYHTYSTLYVSGVIGRHFGVIDQVEKFTNNGDISVYTNGSETYLSGVENADILASATANTHRYASQFKNNAGNTLFYASAFTNGGQITVTGGSGTNLECTNVLNIKAGNGIVSQVSGIYNLSYYQKYNGSAAKTDTAIADQEIDMNVITDFSPVLNVVGGTSTYTTSATTVYNLRNINYNISSAISSSTTFNYTGVASGEYVSYEDIRNEGNLTFTLDYAITGYLTISGLFNEVSAGSKANNLYNAGDIYINYTATFTGNIMASGICYQNKNGFTNSEIELFNPSSNKYNKTLVGSINNAINAGEITVTNTNYASLGFTNGTILSANGGVTTETYYYPSSTPAAVLKGTICTSGITVINESVITNTFNIADMFAANYINDTKRNEVNASGLVTYNIGQYAIIENCANDGDIKAINLSFYMVFSNGQSTVNNTTAQYAFVTSAGIVCHNDEYLNNNNVPAIGSTNNSKQIIAFTINYGSVYSYSYYRNSTSSSAEDFRAISAGIIGQGLLNVVNVMNYGNIYGSEIVSGVFGVVFFNTFASEVNASNKVILANTINYSSVLMIDKGELHHRDTSFINKTYNDFINLNNNSTYYVSFDNYAKNYFNGSIFGIINFNGDTKAKNVEIRYLISFNEDVNLVSAEAQTPTLSDSDVDLSTFFSAYLKFDSGYVLDTYIGKSVQYAPISSGSETVNHVNYYGVFNTNFPFYQAILGNSEYLDVEHHRTDVFISDYFEFIGATYVNPILLDRIGWGSIAYTAAADAFATDLEGIAKFITYIKGLTNKNYYNNLISSALNTDTWLSKCDESILLELTNTLIENEETETILEMLDYIFSTDSTSYSMINTNTRTAILEAILENDLSLDYSSLLDVIITYANGYSSVLANSVLNENDEAGEYLKNYISSLTNSEIENILSTYCIYLKDASTNSYFTYSNSEQIRYDILSAMFENISDNTFYEKLATILGIKDAIDAATINEKTTMYEAYAALSDDQIIDLYKAIIVNNSTSTDAQRLNTFINEMASEINYYLNIINNGYSKNSLSNIYSDVDTTNKSTYTAATSYDTSKRYYKLENNIYTAVNIKDITSSNYSNYYWSTASSLIDERIALWNQIRNTDIFKSYLTTKVGNEYVAKATEFRNTYQSVTYPYTTADTNTGDLSFTYTYNITPSTYFFGPYSNTSKSQPVGYSAPAVQPTQSDGDGHKAIIDVMTKAEADYLYNNGLTYQYQLFYYEYSDSSSNNQLCAVQRNNEDKYAFTWFKTSYSTDFTGGFLSGRYNDNDEWIDESIPLTDDNNESFDANGGGISRFTSNSSGSTGEGNWNSNINRTGTWIITDANNKQHTMSGTLANWADFIIAHEIRHYISYPTTSLHSTQATGVYKYRSSTRWFTWKNGERLVYTSQYIDYSIDDLCKLDGYLTSYDDGTTKDDTERDIINGIFDNYFISDKTNFERIVAAALLERISYIDDDSFYKVTTPTLNQNFTLYYTLTATTPTSYDASKKYYELDDDNNYIEVDSSLVNSSNYNTYYYVTATRAQIYDSTKTYYEKHDIDRYNYDYLDDFFITNIYSNTIVDEGKTPFNYLYQSYSSTTVKQFLSSNVTSDFKDKFIAYCASNQSAYAKLLLELIALDANNNQITYPVSISDLSIDNISSYTNLTVVNESNEIDDETYEYGYTFDNMTIDLDSSYALLELYVAPLNNYATLYYSVDGGATSSEYITEGTIIDINLENNSYITLSSNQNIILYYVYYSNYQYDSYENGSYYELDDSTETYSASYPGYVIYKLPTALEIENYIYNHMSSRGLSDYSLSGYNVSFNVVSLRNSTGGNSWLRYHRIVIDDDGNTSTTNDITVIGTSSSRIQNNSTWSCPNSISDQYLGKYVGLMVANSNTETQNTTYVYPLPSNGISMRGNSTIYRYNLYQIRVNFSYTCEKGEFNEYITTSDIYNLSLANSGLNEHEMIASTLKSSNNYSTKYNNLIIDATHNLIPIDYVGSSYYNSLTSNTYYTRSGAGTDEDPYVYTLASSKYDSNNSYYTRTGAGTNEDPYVYTLASSITSTSYYNSCTSSSYYLRSGTEGNYSYSLATGDYNTSSNYYKLEGEDYVLYGSASKNIKGILGLKYYHTDNQNPEYCVPDLIEKLITSSNEAFISFVDNVVSQSESNADDYEIILRYLINNIGYYSLGDAFKAETTLTTITKDTLAAAYLVSDYKYILKNSTSVYNSFLAGIINNAMADDFQYINSDGSYDIDKFYDFCDEIDYDLSTAGYGIYALSSNQGKLNGQFIPDNLDITSMDAPYMTETMAYGNATTDRLVLQSSNQNEWRGGDASTTAGLAEGTVNYAFYKDMKQVEQSISTAVFELSINYGGEKYYGDIDLTNRTITFYVNTITKGNYNIVNKKFAYHATSNLGSTISVNSTTDGAVQDTFTVTAENTAITANYDIIFRTIDVEFDLTYEDGTTSMTVEPSDNDTTVVLKLDSVTDKELSRGLNLEPYISFVGTETYTMSSEYLTISALSTDHRVDANGDATITIVVSYKLPADSYAITVSICGNSASVDYIKQASTGNSITEFGFDGELLTISSSMTSTIPFGRAYDYSELTDPTSDSFYLYSFEYSSNAKVVITAEMKALLLNTDNNEEVVDGTASSTLVDTGRIYYKVTYTITSESGLINTYYHYLKENTFFDNNTTYADIYADGDSVGTTTDYDDLDEDDRPKYLSDGTFTYLVSQDNYISSSNSWSLKDDMFAQVSFNRGIEPQYRIKYNLSNFYTLGSNVSWAPTAATLANGATVNNTYAGLTVTVSDNNDTGTYTFVYTYTNTGTWDNDEEYTRYYEFPEFVIVKLASTDALLHQLTFLEESIVLGNTATVILPTTVMVPDKSGTSTTYESTDTLYSTEFNSTTRDIVVSSKQIDYNNGTNATTITDYYAIGTVSDADLSYYCPTFAINDYAQMYQYTTETKLTSYGAGLQTATDHTILSNHDNIYLYVPFNNGSLDVVLLVQLDSDGYWSNVYTTEFNVDNASSTLIGTFTADTVNANNAAGATIGGYTVCDYTGSATDNQSLFMDYVGTPLAGHFWYVSYVIFSEDNLTGGTTAGNVRYYHISIIDATNTIQFNVTVCTDTTLTLTDIYLTISENIYKESNNTSTYTSTRQISAYAVDSEGTYSGSRTDIAGYKIYNLRFSLQTLPKGYFYFYIDLPDGYVAVAYTDMTNQLNTDSAPGSDEEGSFLPYTSIITQKVALEIDVHKGTGTQAGAWAVNTTDIYTKQATYSGTIPAES